MLEYIKGDEFMNKNIINFYITANKLKNIIRTGWKEVNIPNEKIESVADHVYGCFVLSLAISSEKNLNLDMEKVYQMLVIKELKKAVSMSEASINSSENIDGKKLIEEVTADLINQNEFVNIYNEFDAQETEEAKFALYVSKLESDLQAKIYELNGDFKLENALDVKNYPEELSKEILPQVKKASDGWILFDRRYYNNNETFTELSKDIQNL